LTDLEQVKSHEFSGIRKACESRNDIYLLGLCRIQSIFKMEGLRCLN